MSFKPTPGELYVRDFLARLDLPQYLDRFVSEGFDQLPSLYEVTEQDLAAMDVKRGHRRLIQREIATLKGIPKSSPLVFNASYREDMAESGGSSSLVGGSTSSSSGNGQHGTISTGRDTSMNGSGGTSSSTQNSSSISSTEDDNGVSDTSMADHPHKRKYRRHAKPDKNAPIKPPSAYVMFSNKVRAELKNQNMSFTDLARIVGERWKSITPQEKEDYEMTAARAKEDYLDSLSQYEQTHDFKAYQHYMNEFKAKQEASGRACAKTRKRVKTDSPGSGSTADSSGNGHSPPLSHGLKDHGSSAFTAFDPSYKSSSSSSSYHHHHHQQPHPFHHPPSSTSPHSHLPPHYPGFHHHSSSQSYPSSHQYYNSPASSAPPVVASASSQSDSTSSMSSNSSSSQAQLATSDSSGHQYSRSPPSPLEPRRDSPTPQHQQQPSPPSPPGEAPPTNSSEDAR